MKQNLSPVAFLLTIVLSATTPANKPSSASGQNPNGEVSTSLSTQERRGKTIYQLGESPSGKEITARIGELEVPGKSMPCAGCHGIRGEGLTEGGVSAGALAWAQLLNSSGHNHPNGRKHKAFNEQSVARATTECIDPSGNKLHVAMPCYQLTAQDTADLIAYLQRLGSYSEPGLTDTSITIAAMIPTQGALASTGAAMRAALAAYFDELNSQGGIQNRKVRMRFVEMTTDFPATVANIKRVINSEEVFAIVGGIAAGVEKEAMSLARTQQMPVIGPSSLLPDETNNRYVFYFLSGATEQARALVNFAATKAEFEKSKLSIVYSESGISPAMANAAESQAKGRGWESVTRYSFFSETFAAPQLLEKLKAERSQTVLFLGSGQEALALMKEAELAAWTPNFLMPGFIFPGIASIPQAFHKKIFLSFPTSPGDISAEQSKAFAALREKYKLPQEHLPSQLAALAAAKVFVAAATHVGRDLDREKLVNVLENFSDYETGLTPKLTFGPKKRIGARGAYIIGIDLEKKTFYPAAGWVEGN